jgi:hypothetical protein
MALYQILFNAYGHICITEVWQTVAKGGGAMCVKIVGNLCLWMFVSVKWGWCSTGGWLCTVSWRFWANWNFHWLRTLSILITHRAITQWSMCGFLLLPGKGVGKGGLVRVWLDLCTHSLSALLEARARTGGYSLSLPLTTLCRLVLWTDSVSGYVFGVVFHGLVYLILFVFVLFFWGLNRPSCIYCSGVWECGEEER